MTCDGRCGLSPDVCKWCDPDSPRASSGDAREDEAEIASLRTALAAALARAETAERRRDDYDNVATDLARQLVVERNARLAVERGRDAARWWASAWKRLAHQGDAAAFAEFCRAEEHKNWMMAVNVELIEAGGQFGDRTVVLATLRALIAERDDLRARLTAADTDRARVRDALKDVRDDFDCDRDAHRYGTTCRACLAASVIGECPGRPVAPGTPLHSALPSPSSEPT